MCGPIDKCTSGAVDNIQSMFIDKHCFALFSPICGIMALEENRTHIPGVFSIEIMPANTQHNARHVGSDTETGDVISSITRRSLSLRALLEH